MSATTRPHRFVMPVDNWSVVVAALDEQLDRANVYRAGSEERANHQRLWREAYFAAIRQGVIARHE